MCLQNAWVERVGYDQVGVGGVESLTLDVFCQVLSLRAGRHDSPDELLSKGFTFS